MMNLKQIIFIALVVAGGLLAVSNDAIAGTGSIYVEGRNDVCWSVSGDLGSFFSGCGNASGPVNDAEWYTASLDPLPAGLALSSCDCPNPQLGSNNPSWSATFSTVTPPPPPPPPPGATLEVKLMPAGAWVKSLTAPYGAYIDIRWSSSAASCNITINGGAWLTGVPGSGSFTGLYNPAGYGPMDAPGSYTGGLNCNGATDSVTLTVQADETRSVDLKIDGQDSDKTVPYNTTVTATWTITGPDMTACEGTVNGVVISGATSPYNRVITGTTTFAIGCHFANGAYRTDQITVSVSGTVSVYSSGGANWVLTGPDGFSRSGNSDAIFPGVNSGTYSLDVPVVPAGYSVQYNPSPPTQVLP